MIEAIHQRETLKREITRYDAEIFDARIASAFERFVSRKSLQDSQLNRIKQLMVSKVPRSQQARDVSPRSLSKRRRAVPEPIPRRDSIVAAEEISIQILRDCCSGVPELVSGVEDLLEVSYEEICPSEPPVTVFFSCHSYFTRNIELSFKT